MIPETVRFNVESIATFYYLPKSQETYLKIVVSRMFWLHLKPSIYIIKFKNVIANDKKKPAIKLFINI